MNLDIQHLQTWIGKTESRTDWLAATPVQALAATLDRADAAPQPGDAIPPLAHWLYFLPLHRQSEIGADGHPKRGGFLPPVPLPRRMWAGSRIEFRRPLAIGSAITRESRIDDVSVKHGKSGPLVFVRVRHELSDTAGVALVDEHDIVYRDLPKPDDPAASPRSAPAQSAWRREIRPDPVLLFRYSALTYNSHRIHYDYPYVTKVEGYPGLIVHGPLLATLLLDLLVREQPHATIAQFEFRAVRPVFDVAPFFVCGQPSADGKAAQLWIAGSDGFLCMDATARLA